MRNKWITLIVATAWVGIASQLDAQTASTGPRLKFSPPKTITAPELRPAGNAVPSTNVVPPSTSGSSLTFRNSRSKSVVLGEPSPQPIEKTTRPASTQPPLDLIESEDAESAEVSSETEKDIAASRPIPPKRLSQLPSELTTDEATEPGISLEFAPPARSTPRNSAVHRDSRVAPAANRSPYGRASQVKPAQAQIDAPPIVGPELVPQPDPISTEGWIHSEPSNEPWVGSPSQTPSYFGPSRYRERFWVRADYLAGWTNGMSLPPLVTTSPDGTPRNIAFATANVANNALVNANVVGFKRVPVAGVLGYPNTLTLFGGERVNHGYRPGGRIAMGTWLTPSRILGVEGDYWALADESTRFRAAGTNGSPIIMRPFFNTDVAVNLPDAEVVNFPPTNQPGLEGQVTVDTLSRFQSAGIRLLINWGCDDGCPDFTGWCGQPVWVDCNLLLGYRWARLDEGVWIQENVAIFADGTDVNAQNWVGTTINVFDSFRTMNQFHGADLGYTTKVTHGRWVFDLVSKIALGSTQSIQTIEGQTVITPVGGGAQTIADTGLLAQRSNVGRHTHNRFSTIPESSLNVGYQLTPRIRVHAGYTFTYWSNVLRGGDQIDLHVNGQYLNNAANITGQNRPIFSPNYGHLFVHTINTGLEAKF